jgi:hypothetical protein
MARVQLIKARLGLKTFFKLKARVLRIIYLCLVSVLWYNGINRSTGRIYLGCNSSRIDLFIYASKNKYVMVVNCLSENVI